MFLEDDKFDDGWIFLCKWLVLVGVTEEQFKESGVGSSSYGGGGDSTAVVFAAKSKL
jgi:hypothetical protein